MAVVTHFNIIFADRKAMKQFNDNKCEWCTEMKIVKGNEHTWSSRHCGGSWESNSWLSNTVGAHLDGSAWHAQAHRQTFSCSWGVVVTAIVVSVKEFLEPLEELKVILKASLNQPLKNKFACLNLLMCAVRATSVRGLTSTYLSIGIIYDAL